MLHSLDRLRYILYTARKNNLLPEQLKHLSDLDLSRLGGYDLIDSSKFVTTVHQDISQALLTRYPEGGHQASILEKIKSNETNRVHEDDGSTDLFKYLQSQDEGYLFIPSDEQLKKLRCSREEFNIFNRSSGVKATQCIVYTDYNQLSSTATYNYKSKENNNDLRDITFTLEEIDSKPIIKMTAYEKMVKEKAIFTSLDLWNMHNINNANPTEFYDKVLTFIELLEKNKNKEIQKDQRNTKNDIFHGESLQADLYPNEDLNIKRINDLYKNNPTVLLHGRAGYIKYIEFFSDLYIKNKESFEATIKLIEKIPNNIDIIKFIDIYNHIPEEKRNLTSIFKLIDKLNEKNSKKQIPDHIFGLTPLLKGDVNKISELLTKMSGPFNDAGDKELEYKIKMACSTLSQLDGFEVNFDEKNLELLFNSIKSSTIEQFSDQSITQQWLCSTFKIEGSIAKPFSTISSDNAKAFKELGKDYVALRNGGDPEVINLLKLDSIDNFEDGLQKLQQGNKKINSSELRKSWITEKSIDRQESIQKDLCRLNARINKFPGISDLFFGPEIIGKLSKLMTTDISKVTDWNADALKHSLRLQEWVRDNLLKSSLKYSGSTYGKLIDFLDSDRNTFGAGSLVIADSIKSLSEKPDEFNFELLSRIQQFYPELSPLFINELINNLNSKEIRDPDFILDALNLSFELSKSVTKEKFEELSKNKLLPFIENLNSAFQKDGENFDPRGSQQIIRTLLRESATKEISEELSLLSSLDSSLLQDPEKLDLILSAIQKFKLIDQDNKSAIDDFISNVKSMNKTDLKFYQNYINLRVFPEKSFFIKDLNQFITMTKKADFYRENVSEETPDFKYLLKKMKFMEAPGPKGPNQALPTLPMEILTGIYFKEVFRKTRAEKLLSHKKDNERSSNYLSEILNYRIKNKSRFDVDFTELEKNLEYVNSKAEEFSKLSSNDLNTQFQKIKNDKPVSPENKLNTLAILREIMFRSTGRFPYAIQMISLLIAMQGDRSALQINTGEGKSITLAMFSAFNVACGKKVDLCTSNMSLAEDGLLENRLFYDLLGIKVSTVTSSTTPKEWLDTDITYTTAAQLNLFQGDLDQQSASNTEIRERTKNTTLILDESDVTLHDDLTQYKIPRKQDDKEVDVNVYKLINAFLDSGFNSDQTILKNIENLQEYLLKSDELSPGMKTIITSMPTEENGKLDKWIQSAISAKALSTSGENSKYIIGTKVVDNKIYSEVKILDREGRPLVGSQWSDGLHQMLSCRIQDAWDQEKSSRPRFNITPETVHIATLSARNLVDRYDSVLAVTGTMGSDLEISRAMNIHGFKTTVLPPRLSSNRKNLGDIYTKDGKGQQSALFGIYQSHFSKNLSQPTVVVSKDIASATNMLTSLQNEILKSKNISKFKPPPTIQFFDGEKGYQYTYDQTKKAYVEKSVPENIIKDSAGLPGFLTVTTPSMGRGTDFKTSLSQMQGKTRHPYGLFVIQTYEDSTERTGEQIQGRSGRQGEYGETVKIINIQDLKKDFNKFRLNLFEKIFINLKFMKKRINKKIEKIRKETEMSKKEELIVKDLFSNVRVFFYNRFLNMSGNPGEKDSMLSKWTEFLLEFEKHSSASLDKKKDQKLDHWLTTEFNYKEPESYVTKVFNAFNNSFDKKIDSEEREALTGLFQTMIAADRQEYTSNIQAYSPPKPKTTLPKEQKSSKKESQKKPTISSEADYLRSIIEDCSKFVPELKNHILDIQKGKKKNDPVELLGLIFDRISKKEGGTLKLFFSQPSTLSSSTKKMLIAKMDMLIDVESQKKDFKEKFSAFLEKNKDTKDPELKSFIKIQQKKLEGELSLNNSESQGIKKAQGKQ
jgi:preprotein translocase subunit SecA